MQTTSDALNTKEKKLDPKLAQYIRSYGSRISDVKQQLIDETLKLGPKSLMQISPDEGAFLTIIVKLLKAKKGIELGTFTGFSSICFAEGMAGDGKLICCDVSEDWTSIARKYWKLTGVENKIDLRIAPALDTLNSLLKDPAEVGTFDFIFIDADKGNYPAYYEASMKLIRSGGLLLIDNTLRGGRVADDTKSDPDLEAIRKTNQMVHSDERVDMVLLQFADGVTLAYKK